ncbi:MAG TPA: DUF1905 domain-containing protein [Solirubrobacterales bacterium]|nr:DUF1905 domain-containing protein [Solirubrobacterales bacterium]
MEEGILEFDGEIWLSEGAGGWHFVTIPVDLVDEIRDRSAGNPKPFGMAPVEVTVGESTWKTSLFADTKRDSYLLPLKAEIRRRERLEAGDEVRVRIDGDW